MKNLKKFIIIGSDGLIGSQLQEYLKENDFNVISINRQNYNSSIGQRADVIINCNGNSLRYKANKDKHRDFFDNVVSVGRTLKDFNCDIYVYISTVDVYSNKSNYDSTHEDSKIDPSLLDFYGFNKWLAERLVEKYSKNYIILRSGTVVGKGLKKGPIFDIINNKSIKMSLESKLAMIDTNLIAECLHEILKKRLINNIYNLSGNHPLLLQNLSKNYGLSVKINKDSSPVYNYKINTKKINRLINIPTSEKIVIDYLNNFSKLKIQNI